ncbi:cytochrome c biogenesis protein, transmembrane region [Moraxella macacae 0408225]|uniref:Cytochrome c biogenesis protein, transmembrane region n=1 Tax=Moraxella macacae 0408225 TaxID=1230338 RepID=L2FBF9_9GAMM|nr:protein-disulfide reductase DsbD domain-containing protein [Moraxella macacae]ELA09778.1 cytochrome c biogenesis protein, transmembrane region [Moraxella macacae 0408225]
MTFLPKKLKKSVLVGILLATHLTTPIAHSDGLGDLFGNTTKTSDILPADQAFRVFPTQKGNVISVRVEVQDGYYAYQDKLKLDLPAGVSATPFSFSIEPKFVDDPDFGRVAVFEKTFTATSTLTSDVKIDKVQAAVKWQGCAKAGLCYPPEKTNFSIQNLSANVEKAQNNQQKNQQDSQQDSQQADVKKSSKQAVATSTAAASTATATNLAAQTEMPEKTSQMNENQVASVAMVDNASALAETASSTSVALASPDTSSQNASAQATTQATTKQNSVSLDVSSQDQDIFGLADHTGLALMLLFLAGLGLAFTPCVLPMLPIVANIVARQHNPTAKKGLLLTGGYGLGVATSYGLIGALIAVFGQSLGVITWLQNPKILLSFALLFVLLGLYMLDFLPIRLPARLSMKLQGLTQVGENRLGSVTGSFVTGFFSALVVSPCVSAPLAGALAGVATVGNPVIGFFALFMLGLGLSTPLILLGATQGNFMPKAGEWMNWVKTGFALMMFAVALLMTERVFISSLMLALWAVWFAVVAIWAYHWQGRGQLLSKAIALIFALWTTVLVLGVALGSTDNWQPLKPLTNQQVSTQAGQQATKQNAPIKIHKLSELEPLLAQYPNVLVDVTADWCIECRIMEKTLFANPPATLANWQVVKLDVTENTPDSKEVYQQLQVFGPPVLLYFQNGKLAERQNGETKRADFEAALNKLSQ